MVLLRIELRMKFKIEITSEKLLKDLRRLHVRVSNGAAGI